MSMIIENAWLRQAQMGVVVDIGQISVQDKRVLQRAVKRGALRSWRGHWYPVPGASWGLGPLKICYGPKELAP